MKINKLVLPTVIFICSACAHATPSKADIDEAGNDQIESTIASENKLWEALNIDNYQMEVKETSNWVDYTLTLTAKNKVVVDFEAKCGYAIIDPDGSNCQESVTRISPNEHTIQALFDGLKESRQRFEAHFGDDVSTSWGESIAITFNPQYHYPQRIEFDNKNVADEESTVEILIFRVLDE